MAERDPKRSEDDRESPRREEKGRLESRLEELLRDDPDGVIPEVVRRAFGLGVRTYKRSEESVRNLAQDIIGSDRVEQVGTRLSGIRDDLVNVFGRELVRYFDRLNLTDEVVKILTSISLELKTEIRFIPNDKKFVKPDVKGSMKVKGDNPDKQPDKQPD